ATLDGFTMGCSLDGIKTDRDRRGHYQSGRQQQGVHILASPHSDPRGNHRNLCQCRRAKSYGHGIPKTRVGYRRPRQRRVEDHHLHAAGYLFLYLYTTPLDVWADHCRIIMTVGPYLIVPGTSFDLAELQGQTWLRAVAICEF